MQPPGPRLQAGWCVLTEDVGGAQDGTARLAPWQPAGRAVLPLQTEAPGSSLCPAEQASWPECWDQTLVMCLGVPGSWFHAEPRRMSWRRYIHAGRVVYPLVFPVSP